MRTTNETIEKYSVFHGLDQTLPRTRKFPTESTTCERIVRNQEDARQLALKVVPKQWVDYVPAYVCIYLDGFLRPIEAGVVSSFEFTLKITTIKRILENVRRKKARHIIIAMVSIAPEHENKESEWMFDTIDVMADKCFQVHKNLFLDAFRFTSTGVLEMVLPKNKPYFAAIAG